MEIKSHPILFSTLMINALLEGRKNMTRRIIKPQPSKVDSGFPFHLPVPDKTGCSYNPIICPYGKVGDLLWVRENFGYYANGSFFYKADGSELQTKHHPSIHMPKIASRLTLEITNIRVERLQDISEEDAKAEGIEPLFTEKQFIENPRLRADYGDNPMSWVNYLWHGLYGLYGGGNKKSDAWDYQYSGYNSDDAKGSYSSLWESLNGKDSWDKNPWVWVIEFKVHKCNFMEINHAK